MNQHNTLMTDDESYDTTLPFDFIYDDLEDNMVSDADLDCFKDILNMDTTMLDDLFVTEPLNLDCLEDLYDITDPTDLCINTLCSNLKANILPISKRAIKPITPLIWHTCEPKEISIKELEDNFWSNIPIHLLLQLIISAYLSKSKPEGQVFLNRIRFIKHLFVDLMNRYERLIFFRNSLLTQSEPFPLFNRDPLLSISLSAYFKQIEHSENFSVTGTWKIQVDVNYSNDLALLRVTQSLDYYGFERFLKFQMVFKKKTIIPQFQSLLRFNRMAEAKVSLVVNKLQMYDQILLVEGTSRNTYPLIDFTFL